LFLADRCGSRLGVTNASENPTWRRKLKEIDEKPPVVVDTIVVVVVEVYERDGVVVVAAASKSSSGLLGWAEMDHKNRARELATYQFYSLDLVLCSSKLDLHLGPRFQFQYLPPLHGPYLSLCCHCPRFSYYCLLDDHLHRPEC